MNEANFLAVWLEGFLYGKIWALNCTLAKEIQLFPDLGLYSGLFAIYLQCLSKRTGTALVLFYAVCLLYVLSAATFVCDLVASILYASNNSICENTLFYQLCRRNSEHCRPNFKLTSSQFISPFYAPNYNKRLLWLPRPMYSSMHNPSYLSSVLFT